MRAFDTKAVALRAALLAQTAVRTARVHAASGMSTLVATKAPSCSRAVIGSNISLFQVRALRRWSWWAICA